MVNCLAEKMMEKMAWMEKLVASPDAKLDWHLPAPEIGVLPVQPSFS